MNKIEELLEKARKIHGQRQKSAATLPAQSKAVAPPKKPEVSNPYRDIENDDEYANVGVKGVIASTEKLLAINRGLVDPDERDSWKHKRVMTLERLLRERIKLDAAQVRRNMNRRIASMKSLKGVTANAMDDYAKGLIVGHALSQPLEEINPLQLLEQARSVTGMGPGGLSSDDSITEDAQALHPSTFGFLCAISGPESGRAGVDTRIATGVKLGSDGYLYQRFYDRKKKKFTWLSPRDMDGRTIKLPD